LNGPLCSFVSPRVIGVKPPSLILRALRGAKAPLFHGTTRIQEFFRNL
jgi:hypothetical protein